MTDKLAFVGDVHGNLVALRAMRDLLRNHGGLHTVFLGDYVNKGSHSAEVLEELLELSREGRVTLLRGNHEAALLEALESRDLTTFIKMGGAMTIRSYVGVVGPDVSAEFCSRFPEGHLELLRGMAERYETDDVVASHVAGSGEDLRFSVSAHTPVGDVPLIRDKTARLDTGCGSASGRLTALLWPSLTYLQVNAGGDAALPPAA